jgi:hypothetical protein
MRCDDQQPISAAATCDFNKDQAAMPQVLTISRYAVPFFLAVHRTF